MENTFNAVKKLVSGNCFNLRLRAKGYEAIRSAYLADGGQIFGDDQRCSFAAGRTHEGQDEHFAVVKDDRGAYLSYTSFAHIARRARVDDEIATY
jgi:hypothetical protein